MHHPQSQVFFVGLKITVVVQEFMVVFQAVSGDQIVDRLAHGHPFLPQGTVVARALNGQMRANQAGLQELSQGAAGFFKISILAESLQHLRQN